MESRVCEGEDLPKAEADRSPGEVEAGLGLEGRWGSAEEEHGGSRERSLLRDCVQWKVVLVAEDSSRVR